MPLATLEQLADFGALRRQLRECRGLAEKRTAVFEAQGRPLVELHVEGGLVVALVRGHQRESRFSIGTPVEQRKLIDEVKRRLSGRDDD